MSKLVDILFKVTECGNCLGTGKRLQIGFSANKVYSPCKICEGTGTLRK